LQRRAQRREVVGFRGVEAHVGEAVLESGPRSVFQRFGFDEAAHLLVNECGESVAVPGLAAERQDVRGFGQVVVQVRHVERGQQLAHREVARAAEDHQVERSRGGGRGGGVGT